MTTVTEGALGVVTPAKERQPEALPMIFFTEMWERFSYYGMRALLVLYLVNAVGMERANALQIYATYTGLVYLTPILGGYLADRYLGKRKGVLIGGIAMAMGHFAMAFPALLHVALGLLIVGNGFFKPNMSTLLGSLYREHDARRDGGFTIYYMGVNLGAFLAPLVAGTLGEKIGWHWGFAAAGVGMCLGLAQFLYSQEKLHGAGLPEGKSRLDGRDWLEIVIISAAAIPLVYLVMGTWTIVGPLWGAVPTALKIALPVALLIALLAYIRRSCPKEEFHGSIAIIILGVFVVFFWMGFEQAGGTMSLFADKQTDRMLGGWEIPASYFQAINPLAIFALGLPFAALWTWVATTRFAISTPTKMALGMIILGLGFIVLAIADAQTAGGVKVGPQWLFIVFILHTMGELCLSPIGLSMVTKLAPTRLVALMMGVWYTANAVANYLAGVLEEMLKGTSFPLYWFLVGSSVGAGVLLLLLTPLIKKLMHGKG